MSFYHKSNHTATELSSLGFTNSELLAVGFSAPVVENYIMWQVYTTKSATLPGTDEDGDSLTYSIITQPTKGTATITNGVLTYTAGANYPGYDILTYKANDGVFDSNTGRITIYRVDNCFVSTTLILMKDGTQKFIKDIKRGDEVVMDINRKKSSKVARLVINRSAFTVLTKIPAGCVGNERIIYCTPHHPFWTNDNKHRILAKHIPNAKPVKCGKVALYNIQFETEGSYYVEMAKTDSLSPWNEDSYLPKHLYFNENLYIDNVKLNGEDDDIRNKPKMILCKNSSFLSILSQNTKQKLIF